MPWGHRDRNPIEVDFAPTNSASIEQPLLPVFRNLDPVLAEQIEGGGVKKEGQNLRDPHSRKTEVGILDNQCIGLSVAFFRGDIINMGVLS